MNFADIFAGIGGFHLSNTQVWKQLGNSVAVDVVEAILRNMVSE